MAVSVKISNLSIVLAFLFFGGLVTRASGQSFYGGYALITNTCPDDTDICGQRSCCPKGTKCHKTRFTDACCPGVNDCHDTVEQLPACADPAWSLYNTTATSAGTRADPICCLPGFKGVHPSPDDYLGSCVPSDVNVSEDESADLVIEGTGEPGATPVVDEPDEGSTAAASGTSSARSSRPTSTSGSSSSSSDSSSAEDSPSSSGSSSSEGSSSASNADDAASSANNGDNNDWSPRGAMIGGIVGGLVGGLLLIAAVAFLCIRRYRKKYHERIAIAAAGAPQTSGYPGPPASPLAYTGAQSPVAGGLEQKGYVRQEAIEADGTRRFEMGTSAK